MDSIVDIVTSRVSGHGQPLLQAGEFIQSASLQWAVREMFNEYPDLALQRLVKLELRHIARTRQNPTLGVVRIPWIQVCLYTYMQSFDYLELPDISFREPYSSGLVTHD